MSQEDLAASPGVQVTPGAVSHWESGRHEPPRSKMLAVAVALDVTIGWLSGEDVKGERAQQIEAVLLQLAIKGDQELLDELLKIESPEQLLDALRARKVSKLQEES
jgi:transcriptional regulator with XRE-family HTH domain